MRSYRPRPLLVATLTWVVAASALAQTADEEFARGRTLRAQHHDAEALAVFRALYERTHAASALAQCGLAEGALGRWVDAETHLAESLALPSDEWTRANRSANANLEAALVHVRGHLGDLAVVSNISGAQVWVGGRLAVTLPATAPLRVIAGSIAFEVRAPGHLTVARVVNVSPRGLAREVVDLVPVPSTPERETAVTAPVPSPARPTPRAVRPPTPANPSPGLRTAAWATVGASAALLAIGGITYAVGVAAAAEYNDDGLCLPAVGTRDDACHGQGRTAMTMLPVSITSFVVGGAAAATAMVLFGLSAPRGGAARPRSAVVCGPGPVAISVSCTGTF